MMKMSAVLAPINSLSSNSTLIKQQNNRQTIISGQLFVALKFVPTQKIAKDCIGDLHVTIKEAHQIAGFCSPLTTNSNYLIDHKPPSGALPNAMCKCFLLSSTGARVTKFKTPTLKRCSNPKWNFKCVFEALQLSKLHCQAIELTVYHKDDSILVSNNEFLGGVRLCHRLQEEEEQGKEEEEAKEKDKNVRLENESLNQLINNNTTNTNNLLKQTSNQNNDNNKTTTIKKQAVDKEGEKEARIWTQMLSRPNIWVYGEFQLRALNPLLAIK